MALPMRSHLQAGRPARGRSSRLLFFPRSVTALTPHVSSYFKPICVPFHPGLFTEALEPSILLRSKWICRDGFTRNDSRAQILRSRHREPCTESGKAPRSRSVGCNDPWMKVLLMNVSWMSAPACFHLAMASSVRTNEQTYSSGTVRWMRNQCLLLCGSEILEIIYF